jgi:hypothetical protein
MLVSGRLTGAATGAGGGGRWVAVAASVPISGQRLRIPETVYFPHSSPPPHNNAHFSQGHYVTFGPIATLCDSKHWWVSRSA